MLLHEPLEMNLHEIFFFMRHTVNSLKEDKTVYITTVTAEVSLAFSPNTFD